MKWVSKLFKSGSNGGSGTRTNHHPPQFQEDENMVFPLPPSSLVIILHSFNLKHLFFHSFFYFNLHIYYRHVIIHIKALYKRHVNITLLFSFHNLCSLKYHGSCTFCKIVTSMNELVLLSFIVVMSRVGFFWCSNSDDVTMWPWALLGITKIGRNRFIGGWCNKEY